MSEGKSEPIGPGPSSRRAVLLPLDEDGDRLPLYLQRWLCLLLVLGIAARVLRWALCFPLWGDEAFLSASFLHRGYRDMFGPLEYAQVCPLLVLWGQLTAVKLWGFSEYGLRLLPLLCSLISLPLFWHLARRMLSGTAFLLAVGIFATSYPLLRYAAEAKQYGCDVLVSLVLLAVLIEWWRRPERFAWLWVLVAITPLAIAGSYPAVFIAGGISLALAARLRQLGSKRGWLLWVVYNGVLVAAFLGCFLLYVRHQCNSTLQGMQGYWDDGFPPLSRPTELVRWFLGVHLGELLPHPIGGPKGRSLLTGICCFTALVLLVRRRQFPLLVLCLAPLGVNFAAALAHRYPYGQHLRMTLYLAPLVCLLAGFGLAAIVGYFQRRGTRWRWVLPTLLSLLTLVPLSSIVRDFASQGKSESDICARAFARWFWPEIARQGEVVCVKTDLNQDLSGGNFQMGYSALYLCNQRIYSPRHARREPPQWQRISADWPLICVRYHSWQYPDNTAAVTRWLDEIQRTYTIVGREYYPQRHTPNDAFETAGVVEVYRCVPKKPPAAAAERPR
jgi:hypothetical protein